MRTSTGQCDSCQMVRINGLVCHETGCPQAWRDERRQCRECGTRFVPEERAQRECSHACAIDYSGAYCDCIAHNPEGR